MSRRPIIKFCPTASLIACALSACTVDDGVLGTVRASGGGRAGIDGTSAGNAGTSTSPPVHDCAPTSPTVTMPGSTGYTTCTGRIAAATFNNALCVCNGVQVGNALVTVGFDSSNGSYLPGQSDDGGAAVGVNGDYQITAGTTEVAGSLCIAGGGDVNFVGSLVTRGDLRIAGNVDAAGYASISRNAWLAGTFKSWGTLTIKGELHHAQEVTAFSLSPPASDTLEPVMISKPCPCAAEVTLDVGALIDDAKRRNDNEQRQVATDALASIGGQVRLALPCGSYYLSKIGGVGNAVIQVDGMTALFIEDSVSLEGDLGIELGAGAELDLFIRNDLIVTGAMTLGNLARPAATRVFVGGTNPIALAGTFVGNLYAPQARVYTLGELDVYGSLFSSEFAGGAKARFIFDRAVRTVDHGCTESPPPAGACSRCGSCTGSAACIDGVCTSCRNDDDCCGQLICIDGGCYPLIEYR